MSTTQTSSSRLEPDVHVSLQPVNALDFEHQVLQSPVPVFVDFTTSWCPPCRVLLPILRQLAAEGAGRFKVVTVDGDESPDLAARFGVRGFPAVIAFVFDPIWNRSSRVTGDGSPLRRTPTAS